MCGIVGLADRTLTEGELCAQVQKMMQKLVHRGPDASGHWVSHSSGLALGHQRLSIVDLSDAGMQPMRSVSGRYVIVFNGEIYNYLKLKKELQAYGAVFKGKSDTEVILAVFEYWGIRRGISKLSGMFAIAVWDNEEKRLVLIRDRMGEKPLYYGLVSGVFLFGSELKALTACKCWSPQIDKKALALYLKHNYIPSPYSIYIGIKKLVPGAFVEVDFAAGSIVVGQPESYWRFENKRKGNVYPGKSVSEAELVDQLDLLLRETIASEMIADVPLGAFLSGGIDSSCVVGIMQSVSNNPVKTFSIGFFDQQYNEAAYAKEVASHLGTEHTEFFVTAKEAMSVIPEMASVYDEPFSDSSQIPTYILSRLTRNEVTVSLSGDGGDELFGGYNRYKWAKRVWSTIGWLPVVLRRLVAGGVQAVSPAAWDRLFGALYRLRPGRARLNCVGDKLHKLAAVVSAGDRFEIYDRLISHWSSKQGLLLDDRAWDNSSCQSESLSGIDFVEWMMLQDMRMYLPDDILVKVDRAAMAVSLETRVPLLDHKVVEFALSLPMEFKIRKGVQKWLLRQVLFRYVPEKLMERPKMGFGIPVGSWLRGPLKEWVLDMLHPERLDREGYFSSDVVQRYLNQHLSGERNWGYYLWDVLMFESWLEHDRGS